MSERATHLVTPRTLVFCERDGRRLFLLGGPAKWFAGRLNGLGGSVEPGEDVEASAAREVEEECGLRPTHLRLGAVLHQRGTPHVMLFVFAAKLPPGEVRDSPEGRLVWLARDEIADPATPLLPDVRGLLASLDRWGQVYSSPTSNDSARAKCPEVGQE